MMAGHHEILYRVRRTHLGDYVADLWHPACGDIDDGPRHGAGDCQGWETMYGPYASSDEAERMALRRFPKARYGPVIVLSTD